MKKKDVLKIALGFLVVGNVSLYLWREDYLLALINASAWAFVIWFCLIRKQ